MVTLHEVITFLVSMQISISSLQTHNVNRCGRSRHLARKLSLRRKRSSPNVFEMAATETITSIILIKLIRVSLGTVRHPRRFKIVVIDIQITLKQMLRDFIGIRVNRAKKSGMVNITSSVNSRERSGKLRKCSSKIITSILSFISGRLATKSNQIKQLIRNGRSASLQRTFKKSFTSFSHSTRNKTRDGLIRVRNIRALNGRFNTSITHAYSIVIGSKHITLNATGGGFLTASKQFRHGATSKSRSNTASNSTKHKSPHLS